jgi:hypothetical protein
MPVLIEFRFRVVRYAFYVVRFYPDSNLMQNI